MDGVEKSVSAAIGDCWRKPALTISLRRLAKRKSAGFNRSASILGQRLLAMLKRL